MHRSIKGSLNEYELDLLRQRSVEARRAKAQRGELIVAAPVGYIKTEEQHLEKDPDRRVQQAIMLVFEKFLEMGSVRQTLFTGVRMPTEKLSTPYTMKMGSHGRARDANLGSNG